MIPAMSLAVPMMIGLALGALLGTVRTLSALGILGMMPAHAHRLPALQGHGALLVALLSPCRASPVDLLISIIVV